jgi:hypothetical protein
MQVVNRGAGLLERLVGRPAVGRQRRGRDCDHQQD